MSTFKYFNESIGYSGQDIHIVRSGVAFPFHKLFQSTDPLDYEVQLPGTGNQKTYANVTVTIDPSAAGGTTALIQANTFQTSTGHIKISNFYITVSMNGVQAFVLVHVHDKLLNAWMTPNPLTFRKDMTVHFGLNARFTGDYIGDISFYPDLNYTITDANLTCAKVLGGRALVNDTGALPAPLPKDYPNSISLNLPLYIRNTGTTGPTSVTGGVQVRAAGTTELVVGKDDVATPNPVDRSINMLFIGDGFDGSANCNKDTFLDFVRQIRAQMRESVSSPWNHFENMNFWGHYLEGREQGGVLGGEYLILSESGSQAKGVAVQDYIKMCDAIVRDIYLAAPYPTIAGPNQLQLGRYVRALAMLYSQDMVDRVPWTDLEPNVAVANSTETFPLLTPPVANGKILDLGQLCSLVGLPGVDDVGKSYNQKKTHWTTLGVTNDPNTFYQVNFVGQPANASQYFLSKFVFDMWLTLATPRVAIDKPDTAFGIRRQPDVRPAPFRTFKTAPTLDFGSTQLANWKDLSLYISRLTVGTSSFGATFYDASGKPVYSGDDTVVTENGVTTTYKGIGNADNVLILTRVPKYLMAGVNYSVPDKDPASTATNVIQYTNHRVITNVYREKDNPTVELNVVPANTGVGKPKSYFPKPIPISSLSAEASNSAIHEFSHKFLLDEYTRIENSNLSAKNSATQAVVTAEVRESNLQTRYSLLLDQSNLTGGITGDAIKWRYPRIVKAAVGAADLANAATSGEFLFKATAATSFAGTEHVLLRQKKLFDAPYVHCTIVSISTADPTSITIKPVAGNSITLNDFKKGCVLIKPRWRSETGTSAFTEYLELVHPTIRARINGTEEALVPKDLNTRNYDKQEPEVFADGAIPGISGADPVKAFEQKSNIVGLFAGGLTFSGDFDEGLYHPTGFCIMRKTATATPNQFCQVCKYIIVDSVDPLQHPQIDAEYTDYPTV